MSTIPHFLLFAEASCTGSDQSWRFVLHDVETSRRMVISDSESTMCGERLELLAVVRGLEALDGPARVTLVTRSRYVSRGIRFGITEWRANEWVWERFGRVVPVKDHDLWQRIDRALLFHRVECQSWQFEAPATEEPMVCRSSEMELAQVEAVKLIRSKLGCSEINPNPCSPRATHEPTDLSDVKARLAPTKRRLVIKNRRRPHLQPSPVGNLAAAVICRAMAWADTLRGETAGAVPGAA
jgi:ribonuclease HI